MVFVPIHHPPGYIAGRPAAALAGAPRGMVALLRRERNEKHASGNADLADTARWRPYDHQSGTRLDP
jgi:hypothetical protein